jgi:hypothetical protein
VEKKEQRVIKIFPYSYSSLTSFETCPRKHYGERLSKEFARPYNKAADQGDIWHKEAEAFAKEGTPIPDTNPYREHMMAVIEELRGKGDFFAELELAVRGDLSPCGWWDKDCYTRDKLDLACIGEDEAYIIDWKTGRRDPFSTQLKKNALMLFLHYPDIQKVHYRYEWLKEPPPTKGTVHREFFDVDWAKFEKRVVPYRKAFDTNNWPAKKSGLCKNYCGVTTCENYGKAGR